MFGILWGFGGLTTPALPSRALRYGPVAGHVAVVEAGTCAPCSATLIPPLVRGTFRGLETLLGSRPRGRSSPKAGPAGDPEAGLVVVAMAGDGRGRTPTMSPELEKAEAPSPGSEDFKERASPLAITLGDHVRPASAFGLAAGTSRSRPCRRRPAPARCADRPAGPGAW
ncbi:hypothetical protein ACRAWD_26315 [Caulobacter segnis]